MVVSKMEIANKGEVTMEQIKYKVTDKLLTITVPKKLLQHIFDCSDGKVECECNNKHETRIKDLHEFTKQVGSYVVEKELSEDGLSPLIKAIEDSFDDIYTDDYGSKILDTCNDCC